MGPTSSALTSQILAQYNHAIEISAGQALPAPAEIDGYVYVGYLKDSKAIEQATSEGIRTETIVNKTEAIPFEIQTVENPQLSAGTERVVQEGQDGERTVTIKQVHSKGQIISEEELSSTVTKLLFQRLLKLVQNKQPMILLQKYQIQRLVTSYLPYRQQKKYLPTRSLFLLKHKKLLMIPC